VDHASQLIAFYSGDGTDNRGRTLAEIWAWDDEQLEYVHDYIQWLFPLAEASMFNFSAPILTADDIKQFRGKPDLRCNLRKSFQRMLSFYGFVLDETGAGAVISPGPQFSRHAMNWLTPNNHNFLRLTRIMKSTTLLGMPSSAQALLACLEDLHASEAGTTIGPRTMQYWRQTVRS
jgi:Opioid growth factor receptor (OGFr) conserved region